MNLDEENEDEELNAPISKPTSSEKLEVGEEVDDSVSTTASSYQIKPSLSHKFKELQVKEIIRNVVAAFLTGKSYDPDRSRSWSMQITNEINEKVKDLQMKKYKHIVQVIIGEMKGAGAKSGVRCVWDSDVDSYASEIFINGNPNVLYVIISLEAADILKLYVNQNNCLAYKHEAY